MSDCNSIVPALCGNNGLVFPQSQCGSVRIDGVDDVTINQGVGIDLTEGVTAYDKNGNEIEFTVSPDAIDKCDVGEHSVLYTATGADDIIRPSVCGEDELHVPCDGTLGTVVEERIVTITQADPPTFEGVDAVTILPNTDFDPMNGVSAVDDNGNPLEVEYDGTYALMARGAIASFNADAIGGTADNVTITIEPQQDLHGYDSPWAGGGGKNKWNVTSQTSSDYHGITAVLNSDGSISLSGTNDGTLTTIVISSCYLENGVEYLLSGGYNSNIFIRDTTASVNQYGSTHVTLTGSGGQHQFQIRVLANTAITGTVTIYPMIRLSSVSDGTWQPYSNICPISGWTGANVTDCGKNLFDKSGGNIIGGYFVGGNSSITEAYVTDRGVAYIPCKPNAKYVASRERVVSLERFYMAYTKEYPAVGVSTYGGVSATASGTVGDKMSLTITTEADAKYLVVWAYWSSATEALDTLQIELGSTPTSYEAYQGTTTNITWQTEAGTVYGGTLDVTEGALQSTLGVEVFDGTEDWQMVTSPNRFYVARTSNIKKGTSSQGGNLSSNMFKWNGLASGSISLSSGQFAWFLTGNVYIRLDDVSSVEDFKQMLSENNLQIMGELATPQTYQLTPTEISLLQGDNNVWADCGDTEVVWSEVIPQGEEYQYQVEGNYTITYHAEDECGNVGTAIRTITVA